MSPQLRYSRGFPVALEDALDRTLPTPLPEILGTRHLAIPGVVRVEEDGVWGTAGVGQHRTLHFSDGGHVRETLTRLDRPTSFAYTLDEVHGPMKALFGSVDGVWAFEPVGTGTRITWSWDVTTTPVGRLVMPVFARMWNGAARRAFDNLETHLLA